MGAKEECGLYKIVDTSGAGIERKIVREMWIGSERGERALENLSDMEDRSWEGIEREEG